MIFVQRARKCGRSKRRRSRTSSSSDHFINLLLYLVDRSRILRDIIDIMMTEERVLHDVVLMSADIETGEGDDGQEPFLQSIEAFRFGWRLPSYMEIAERKEYSH